MPKTKKLIKHNKPTTHHNSSSSNNSLFKTSILGHKLTPPVLIVIGAGLVILQGIIALVGFAVIVFGIVSLVTNIFKNPARK